MWAPGCHDAVVRQLSRRGFFRRAAIVSAAAALSASAAPDTAVAQTTSFSRVVDLTHTLSPGFPTFTGEPYLTVQQKMFLDRDGYNVLEWTLFEHVGTHLDAPIHFANDAPSADLLTAASLVVPLAVSMLLPRPRPIPTTGFCRRIFLPGSAPTGRCRTT